MLNFLKKYQLIIFLAFFAGFLLVLKLLILPDTDEPGVIEDHPPTPIPEKTISPAEPDFELTPTPSQLSPTVPALKPPPEEEEAEVGITKEEFMEEVLRNYPLSPYLPYPDENISIRYTDILKLEIAKKEPFTDQEKEEVLQWIKNQGVDPETHQIIWEVK